MKSNILDLLLTMANVLNLGDFDTYENRYDILTHKMIETLHSIDVPIDESSGLDEITNTILRTREQLGAEWGQIENTHSQKCR
nr:MAG TPA: hypothetical protein [Caudoviricetes sp.]